MLPGWRGEVEEHPEGPSPEDGGGAHEERQEGAAQVEEALPRHAPQRSADEPAQAHGSLHGRRQRRAKAAVARELCPLID